MAFADETLSLAEWAALNHMSTRTARRLVNQADGLPAIRLGRHQRVHVPTADRWLLARLNLRNPTRRRGRAA